MNSQTWTSEKKNGSIHIHPNLLLSIIAGLLVLLSGLITYIWSDYKKLAEKRYNEQTELNEHFSNEIKTINNKIKILDYRVDNNEKEIKKNLKNIEKIEK